MDGGMGEGKAGSVMTGEGLSWRLDSCSKRLFPRPIPGRSGFDRDAHVCASRSLVPGSVGRRDEVGVETVREACGRVRPLDTEFFDAAEIPSPNPSPDW